MTEKIHIGWREWAQLPALGISRIKAKIDTGARTSVLHAFELELYEAQGKQRVRFSLHPKQRSTEKIIVSDADLLDTRWVVDSGGHRELRPFIQTEVVLGTHSWLIETSLTCRKEMRFRMLLGRTALSQHFLVEPCASYLLGKPPLKVKI